MKEVIWYLLRLPVKIYYLTWVFVLILAKRKIPKWLQQRIDSELKNEPILGQAIPYKR